MTSLHILQFFYRVNKAALSLGAIISLTNVALAEEKETSEKESANVKWQRIFPVDNTTVSTKQVKTQIVGSFLSDPDIMRRDPSDIIRVGDKYYVWYTKVLKGQSGYPHGWSGSVWYATSKDGHQWEEVGMAISAGSSDAWDGVGAYTPNIMSHGERYYLAYTAMPLPHNKYSQASIGMAVSESPDGPWEKLKNNPVILHGDSLDDPDGFLVDDAVFVSHNNKTRIYFKGYPKEISEKNGRVVRAKGRNTFLMMATSDSPEGPYTKDPTILQRGHEAVVWKDEDGFGSLCIGWGAQRVYTSTDGIDFKSMYALTAPKAAGIYRADFNKEGKGARPAWGIAMGENQGLCRFEFIWPKEDDERKP